MAPTPPGPVTHPGNELGKASRPVSLTSTCNTAGDNYQARIMGAVKAGGLGVEKGNELWILCGMAGVSLFPA